MSGEEYRVSPLESRKQLLIAESELNRAELFLNWQSMAHGVGDLAHRAKTIGAWASSAALVVAGVAALRRGPPAPGTAKSSWFQKIRNGARVTSMIWFVLRARRQKDDQKWSRSPTRTFAGNDE